MNEKYRQHQKKEFDLYKSYWNQSDFLKKLIEEIKFGDTNEPIERNYAAFKTAIKNLYNKNYVTPYVTSAPDTDWRDLQGRFILQVEAEFACYFNIPEDPDQESKLRILWFPG